MMRLFTLLLAGANAVLLVLICVVLAAPLVGTALAAAGWRWDLTAVGVVFLVAIALAIVVLRRGRHLFVEDGRSLGYLVVLLAGTGALYWTPSPILEVTQDPGVYLFKAMNLINHGTPSKPAPTLAALVEAGVTPAASVTGYGTLLNGCRFDGAAGRIDLDFYPGGTYLHALLGTFRRDLAFRAGMVVMLANVVLLYGFCRRETDDLSAAMATAVFVASPVHTWFGRGPYSEPHALFAFLGCLLCVRAGRDALGPVVPLLIAFIFQGMTSRLDMLPLALVGGAILYRWNGRAGLAYSAATVLLWIALQHAFAMYFERLAEASVVVRHGTWILAAGGVLGFVLFGAAPIDWDRVMRSRPVAFAMLALVVVLAAHVFRDDWTAADRVEWAYQNRMPFRRTWNEEIFERLFLVFPPFMLVAGLLYLPWLARARSSPTGLAMLVFGMFVPVSYYLLDMNVAPPMYWALRRYVPVILPALLVGYVAFLDAMPLAIRRLAWLTTLVLLANTHLGAGQSAAEMRGLDRIARVFTRAYPEARNYILAYDRHIAVGVSPFISYGRYDPVPIAGETMLAELLARHPDREILYVSAPKDVKVQPDPVRQDVLTFGYDHMDGALETLPTTTAPRRRKFLVREWCAQDCGSHRRRWRHISIRGIANR